ncbi:MAG: hypothetical protein EBT09_00885 [Actinobacteria bacterium]|nr:hypothetical protein [Actinomycetota bacterium]
MQLPECGRGAVILISDADLVARQARHLTFGHLLAACSETGLLGDDVTARPWVERGLGVGFE